MGDLTWYTYTHKMVSLAQPLVLVQYTPLIIILMLEVSSCYCALLWDRSNSQTFKFWLVMCHNRGSVLAHCRQRKDESAFKTGRMYIWQCEHTDLKVWWQSSFTFPALALYYFLFLPWNSQTQPHKIRLETYKRERSFPCCCCTCIS